MPLYVMPCVWLWAPRQPLFDWLSHQHIDLTLGWVMDGWTLGNSENWIS